jgi:FkbM family methyltransferase
VARAHAPELAYLADVFGPARHSYGPEEWAARYFFGDRRGGVFLDVGAAHPQRGNNTLTLERDLGWSGVAVDAQARYAPDYAALRPRTQFVAAFVSDTDDQTAELHHVASRPDVASGAADFSRRWGTTTTVHAPTVTLTSLLDRLGIERVDFVSMDIELFEPKALAGFDIDRFRPALVCVESHPEVRQALLNYFADHGYVVVGAYLRMDEWNLYFAPRDSQLPTFPQSVFEQWTGHARRDITP